MNKIKNKKMLGDRGENDVARLVPCPNCKKPLMSLPKNYPLFDMQCTGCAFRVQVKTNNSKPKNVVFGAGWDIMEKVLKSGHLTPPLMVNFKWKEKRGHHQKILFFPFIPKEHLQHRKLSPTARRANYKMFNYVGLLRIPHFTLYER